MQQFLQLIKFVKSKVQHDISKQFVALQSARLEVEPDEQTIEPVKNVEQPKVKATVYQVVNWLTGSLVIRINYS